VTLPLARTGEALRALSSPEELEQVRRTLCADVPPSTEPWSSRQRATREKLAAGTVTGLAEVVRDGLQRERIYAARKGGRLAGPSERELYLQARKLLAAEIALSRGIDVAAADDWIAEQVGDSPGETDSAT
jgi:RNA polymerase-interacting CarD/CdnL/TRCF family regulator